MCNFMSLRVVNLDNRPFYTVVKQIIKKQKHSSEKGGFVKRRNFHLHNDSGALRMCRWEILVVFI
jgi:hypothetical protein